MAGFRAPEVGAHAAWMRDAMLVAALAAAGAEGAMAQVPGSRRLEPGAFVLLGPGI